MDLAERSEAPNPGDHKGAEPPYLAALTARSAVSAASIHNMPRIVRKYKDMSFLKEVSPDWEGTFC